MIELRNSQKSLEVDQASVISLCEYILEKTGLSDCDLSISLVDDEEMVRLNQRYFGKNRCTDVISFPMEDKAKNGILLGDVVVCVPQAVRTAGEYSGVVEDELSLYLIHGILHLAGERDESPEEKRNMEERQQSLLDKARDNGKMVIISNFC